jgi:hypothetical protein
MAAAAAADKKTLPPPLSALPAHLQGGEHGLEADGVDDEACASDHPSQINIFKEVRLFEV